MIRLVYFAKVHSIPLLVDAFMIYSIFYLQVGTGARSEKIRTYNFKVLNVAVHIFSWFGCCTISLVSVSIPDPKCKVSKLHNQIHNK